ncbi:MAG: Re/Si-specific NAD(P)(+) transhydrogenase subunit alpha [Gemmatimonadota bacterium]|jgi:NAD(P) transhydrogenase subunit alpha
MKVAVLAETRPGESRVALNPALVRELVDKHGLEVAVQKGAGTGSHHADAEYEEAGATLGDASSVLSGADVVLKVQAPTPEEVGDLPVDAVLVSFLSPFANLDVVERMRDRKITSFAMELIPRTTRAQRMDALSSQATVAGYKAVLMGANALHKLLPMFMTAAGTIRPGKVLVLGAGVAGLQAIATARRLGAKVEAFDVRPAVKEQVESLGAKFLETEHDVTAEGEGGYAKELSEEQHQRELELIAAHVTDTDLVVTTAQIPGREAPLLITDEMLQSMRRGSVVVDLAAASGGNCAGSKPGETVEVHGVVIMGPDNLPAAIPVHATQMYARNIVTFLLEMVDEGELNVDMENDVVGPSCLTHDGSVVHEATAEKLGGGGGADAAAPSAEVDAATKPTTGTGAGEDAASSAPNE